MKQTTKRVWYVTAGFLAFVLAAGLALGIYYVAVLRDTIEQVATPEKPTTLLSLYVLSDDPAQAVSQMKGYVFGICSVESDQDELAQMQQKLSEALGQEPATASYADLFSLADALYGQSCRAMVLNEAYLDSMAEAEGYAWLRDGIRKVDSYEFEEKEEPAPSESTSIGQTAPPESMPQTFVMYISGIDTFGKLSARSRSDVNILAVVNTKANRIFLLSTPRDYYVSFAATGGKKDKLTHAGIYGIRSSVDALERLYGVTVDYYLRINFSGFVDVIDALGGIEVYSQQDFEVEGIKQYQKGYNQLTGIEALAFARERYSFAAGDYQRAQNQMEVIRAVVDKCTSPAILKNYRGVMNGIAGSFQTNMPQDQIESLVAMQLVGRKQWEISTYAATGANAYRETYSMPGRKLFVILPDLSSIEQAKQKIRAAS